MDKVQLVTAQYALDLTRLYRLWRDEQCEVAKARYCQVFMCVMDAYRRFDDSHES